jgi:hypothetical protein
MNVIEAIKTRKSIRGYRPDPVPREVLRNILGFSRQPDPDHPGTHRRDHPLAWHISTDKSRLLRHSIFVIRVLWVPAVLSDRGCTRWNNASL